MKIPEYELATLLRDIDAKIGQDEQGELKAFLGDDDVVIYGIDEDPYSSQYQGYVTNILTNHAILHTLEPSERDGGIKKRHVSGRKVLLVGHAVNSRYADLLQRRVRELQEEGVLAPESVRYMTAHPYKLRRLDELYPQDNGENGGDKAKTDQYERGSAKPRPVKAALKQPKIEVGTV